MKLEAELKEFEELENKINWLESRCALLEELFNSHTVVINKLEKAMTYLSVNGSTMTIETLPYKEGYQRALHDLKIWINQTNLERFCSNKILDLNSKEILEKIELMKKEKDES